MRSSRGKRGPPSGPSAWPCWRAPLRPWPPNHASPLTRHPLPPHPSPFYRCSPPLTRSSRPPWYAGHTSMHGLPAQPSFPASTQSHPAQPPQHHPHCCPLSLTPARLRSPPRSALCNPQPPPKCLPCQFGLRCLPTPAACTATWPPTGGACWA